MDILMGNSSFKTAVSNMILNKKLPHAILITGEEGSGKKSAALYLAASALCERGNGEPCGTCDSCRKIIGGIHADVNLYTPEESGNYKVETARKIKSDSFIRANEGKYKVYIISEISAMNKSSANAILKVLEEPSQNVLFILTASSEDSVLPTVLSRTMRFRTTLLNERETVEALFEKFPKAEAESIKEAANLSGGNLGKAIEMLKTKEKDKNDDFISVFLSSLCEKDGYSSLVVLNNFSEKKKGTKELLEQMYIKFSEALISNKTGAQGDEICLKLKSRFTASALMEIMKNIERAASLADSNVSAKNVLTFLQIKIRQSLLP